MKKTLLLLFSLIVAQIDAADWFKNTFNKVKEGVTSTVKGVEKETKAIVKTVESEADKTVNVVKKGFENPEAVAIDAAKQAVKVAGINVNGIERSIESLKGSVDKIKSDIDALKASVNAPTSPMTKAPGIATRLQQFQLQGMSLIKTIGVGQIQSALASPKALLDVVGNLTSATTQTDIKNLYTTYDGLLSEVDSVDIRPILGSMQMTLDDVAKTIDTALTLFTYAGAPGKLAQIVVGSSLLNSAESISSDLKKLGNDLGAIKQGGLLSVRESKVDFAISLITNLDKILPLVVDIQKKPGELMQKVTIIIPIVAKIKDEFAALQSTAMGIESRLKSLMQNKIKTVAGTFDVPKAAIQELEAIVGSMRSNLNKILIFASDTIMIISDILNEGVKGIDGVQKAIGFDLLPAQSRAGARALPEDTKKLAQSIEQLRVAIKNR